MEASYTDLGIATAVQVGTLIWTVATVKTNIKNLTDWLRQTAADAAAARITAAELKGHVESLPCNHCKVTLTK